MDTRTNIKRHSNMLTRLRELRNPRKYSKSKDSLYTNRQKESPFITRLCSLEVKPWTLGWKVEGSILPHDKLFLGTYYIIKDNGASTSSPPDDLQSFDGKRSSYDALILEDCHERRCVVDSSRSRKLSF